MKNVRNLNIWKAEEPRNHRTEHFYNTDVATLNLSVRSYNCLKRANCHTVGDILEYMGEDGQGLRKIRNLGNRSEAEIIEQVEALKEMYKVDTNRGEQKTVTLIKPAKKVWDRRVEEFPLSKGALAQLKACGIAKIGDLYIADTKQDPGWHAVRELFETISN